MKLEPPSYDFHRNPFIVTRGVSERKRERLCQTTGCPIGAWFLSLTKKKGGKPLNAILSVSIFQPTKAAAARNYELQNIAPPTCNWLFASFSTSWSIKIFILP